MKLLIVLIILINQAYAKDLGTFGETFLIREQDLLEEITMKLSKLQVNGNLHQHQVNLQQQTLTKLASPSKVVGIVKTKQPNIFLHDPTIYVPQNIADHKGQIFAKTGTRFNPLEVISFNKTLIFIDGDDSEQINWALKETTPLHKIILVNGAPLKLTEQYKQPFYFDQHGTLIKKLGIKQIPARVTQKNHHLQIEELALE